MGMFIEYHYWVHLFIVFQFKSMIFLMSTFSLNGFYIFRVNKLYFGMFSL